MQFGIDLREGTRRGRNAHLKDYVVIASGASRADRNPHLVVGNTEARTNARTSPR